MGSFPEPGPDPPEALVGNFRLVRVGPLSTMRVAAAFALCWALTTAVCVILLGLAASVTGLSDNVDKLAESLAGGKDIAGWGVGLTEVAAAAAGLGVILAVSVAAVAAMFYNHAARLRAALEVDVAPAAPRRRR